MVPATGQGACMCGLQSLALSILDLQLQQASQPLKKSGITRSRLDVLAEDYQATMVLKKNTSQRRRPSTVSALMRSLMSPELASSPSLAFGTLRSSSSNDRFSSNILMTRTSRCASFSETSSRTLFRCQSLPRMNTTSGRKSSALRYPLQSLQRREIRLQVGSRSFEPHFKRKGQTSSMEVMPLA